MAVCSAVASACNARRSFAATIFAVTAGLYLSGGRLPTVASFPLKLWPEGERAVLISLAREIFEGKTGYASFAHSR